MIAKKIKDFTSWNAEDLKRKLQFKKDLYKAFEDLEYLGKHLDIIILDIVIIGMALKTKGLN